MSNEELIKTARVCASNNGLLCRTCPLFNVDDCSGNLIISLADALEARPIPDKAHAMAVAVASHDYFVRED